MEITNTELQEVIYIVSDRFGLSKEELKHIEEELIGIYDYDCYGMLEIYFHYEFYRECLTFNIQPEILLSKLIQENRCRDFYDSSY